MNTIKIKLNYLLLALLAGCSTASYQTDYDQSVDFSALKTYSWGESSITLKEGPNTSDIIIERVAGIVRDDLPPIVDEVLASKGLSKLKNGDADLTIKYTATGDTTNEFRRFNYAPGARAPSSNMERSGAMMMGTITISVIETKTNKVIWQGESESLITGEGGNHSRLRKIITTLIEDFPPAN